MNASERKRLEATTYHEAGHAVAAYLLKQPIRYVTVLPGEDGSLGHCAYAPPGEGFRPDVNVDMRTRARLEAMIMTAYAGAAAQVMSTTATRRRIWPCTPRAAKRS